MFQEDIGNIHRFIQQTARIGAQIEDVTQRLVPQGFFNAPDRRLHIRPRISGKADDINDANAVLDFPADRLEFNDFACDSDVEGLLAPRPDNGHLTARSRSRKSTRLTSSPHSPTSLPLSA